ncbi:MAG: hypothetical protein ACP5GO_05930 [Thermoprotei archaeon]
MLIRGNVKADSNFLSRLKKGCALIRLVVGLDNVDLEAAKQFGIRVCNTPCSSSVSVAEHALREHQEVPVQLALTAAVNGARVSQLEPYEQFPHAFDVGPSRGWAHLWANPLFRPRLRHLPSGVEIRQRRLHLRLNAVVEPVCGSCGNDGAQVQSANLLRRQNGERHNTFT